MDRRRSERVMWQHVGQMATPCRGTSGRTSAVRCCPLRTRPRCSQVHSASPVPSPVTCRHRAMPPIPPPDLLLVRTTSANYISNRPIAMAESIGGFNQRQGEALPPQIFFEFVPIYLYCSNAQNWVSLFSGKLAKLLPPDVTF